MFHEKKGTFRNSQADQTLKLHFWEIITSEHWRLATDSDPKPERSQRYFFLETPCILKVGRSIGTLKCDGKIMDGP